MIGRIATMTRWEWFKLRRRWMPWILFAILLLFSQLGVWGAFFQYRSLEASGGMVSLPTANGRLDMVGCNDLKANPTKVLPPGTGADVITGLLAQCQAQGVQQQSNLQKQYDTFTLPGSLPTVFGIAQGIGMILLAILTASAIGSEYGMGTLRPILIRGTGRWTFLASKFLVLILVAAVAFLVVGAVSVVSSVVATGLANLPPGGVIAGSTWTDAAAALGKGWGSLIPYVVFTALLTIVTRSSAAGMAIGLGYAFAEPIMVALLKLLFSGFGTVAEYLLAQNISAFTSGKLAFNQGTTAGPGQVHAALVLAAYTIVFGIVAVWLFQRRDIAGANAG